MPDKADNPPITQRETTNHLEEADHWDLDSESEPSTQRPKENLQPEEQNLPKNNNNKLTVIEKISLTMVAVALLGLAVYSYAWLRGKNIDQDGRSIDLPHEGKHITITKLSTFWKTVGNTPNIKMGAKVIPSLQVSLDPEASTTGALRVYFQDTDNNRIGDTITIAFKDGKLTNENNSSVVITENGITANITASNGFHQEGDFSAYMLDPKLAWEVHLSEAHSPTASGSDFKEILTSKISPIRK